LFQRILGNPDSNPLLAKSGKKKQPYSLNENYRHEFASLIDVQRESEFQKFGEDMKELVFHLIAAHHGRGRPHFPTQEAYDPEATDENNSILATEVPQRFARLQRKYGRWGLAYLESLLRAADYAASANPSAIWKGNQ
jgi:CRISPR-associated endonuclease/helicase Cas3